VETLEQLPVSLSPEVKAREEAYDDFMRGDEQPLLAIREREALMEEMGEVKRDLGYRHAHGHAHRQLHRKQAPPS
jgi:hypothetical protein